LGHVHRRTVTSRCSPAPGGTTQRTAPGATQRVRTQGTSPTKACRRHRPSTVVPASDSNPVPRTSTPYPPARGPRAGTTAVTAPRVSVSPRWRGAALPNVGSAPPRATTRAGGGTDRRSGSKCGPATSPANPAAEARAASSSSRAGGRGAWARAPVPARARAPPGGPSSPRRLARHIAPPPAGGAGGAGAPPRGACGAGWPRRRSDAG